MRAFSIFFRIAGSSKAGLTDSQKEKITSLLDLLRENPKTCSAESKTRDQIDYYTIDDVLTEAKNHPLGYRRKLEKLRTLAVGPVSGKTFISFFK